MTKTAQLSSGIHAANLRSAYVWWSLIITWSSSTGNQVATQTCKTRTNGGKTLKPLELVDGGKMSPSQLRTCCEKTTKFERFFLFFCAPIPRSYTMFAHRWRGLDFFLHSGNARSRHLSCLVPSFTNFLRQEREKNHLNIGTQQCQWWELNLGCQHSKQ